MEAGWDALFLSSSADKMPPVRTPNKGVRVWLQQVQAKGLELELEYEYPGTASLK